MPSTRFSRWSGGLHIGADYFERRGALREQQPTPTGLVDSMSDLRHAGIDVERIHPAIVAFFDDTAGLELLIRSHWHFPFRRAR